MRSRRQLTATIVVLNISVNITDQRFCFTPTNCSQVFSLLNKLSKSKATDLDNTYARLIRRECDDLICFSQYLQDL